LRFELRVAPRAELEIRKAAEWWQENRPAVRDLFRQELTHAFDLITTEPGVGSRARDATLPDVRRIHLYRIHYYLFYRVRGAVVDVLAFWHTNRGAAPQL
jgi:plasmid stabilization system protein ParE